MPEEYGAFEDDLSAPRDENGDEEPLPTGEQIDEKAKQAKRWYTTAEVIAHLRSLDTP